MLPGLSPQACGLPVFLAHRIQAACYPAELGTGILPGDFPVSEVLCSDTLGPSEPTSPQLPTPAQKSRSQFSSSRLATGNQLFSSSQELKEEGNRPPPFTRAHTRLPTHPSARPWLSQPPSPVPPRTRVPGLSQLPGSPRLNRDAVGGGGQSRRPRRKGREPPSPSRVFPSLS